MHSMRSFVLLLFSKALIWEIACIRLMRIVIPKEVVINGNATFICQYKLESDSLYSLKWYKRINDKDEEFFSYIQNIDKTERYHRYELPGVHLDQQKSSTTGDVLYVYNIDLASQGLYVCEVSADHTFQTVKLESYLTVLVPPIRPPLIYGANIQYRIGEVFSGYCYTFFSKPKSQIKWYINEEEAPDFYLTNYNDSTSGLRFNIERTHFVNRKLSVRCMAYIDTQLEQMSEEAVISGIHDDSDAPLITGLESNYRIGDYLNVNCVMPALMDQSSYPQLQWYIHNDKANALFEKRYPIKNTIGLRFRIMPYHLDDNSSLVIKCSATQLIIPDQIPKTHKSSLNKLTNDCISSIVIVTYTGNRIYFIGYILILNAFFMFSNITS